MCKKKKYKIIGIAEVITYNWMLKRAKIALDEIISAKDAQMFYCMDVLMYSAFAIEAFLNHIGEDILKESWREKDATIDKLKLIKQKLNIKTTQGEEPYQSISMLFKYRNMIAHGKTENNLYEDKVLWLSDEERKIYTTDSEWMIQSNINNATKIYNNVKSIIKEIYEKAGYKDSPFTQLHSSSRTTILLD